MIERDKISKQQGGKIIVTIYYYQVLKFTAKQWCLFEELGTPVPQWICICDTRKRFDALGREVCSRRRARCQEADIAANESPRNVCVCGVRQAHCPTVSFRRKVMRNQSLDQTDSFIEKKTNSLKKWNLKSPLRQSINQEYYYVCLPPTLGYLKNF